MIPNSHKLVCSRCRADCGTAAARAEHEQTCTGSPPASTVPYQAPYRPTPRDRELVRILRMLAERQSAGLEMAENGMSEWELNFSRSVARQVERVNYQLSEKQRDIAERIVSRINAQAPIEGL